jgi:uroporphyrinogen decarboxylase
MRFLDACRRRPVDATPIWIMRQAGRYLPEYRAIRDKLSFIEMCRRPEVATEVTLQPLRRFELDAAIVFADILLPLEGMGIGFHFAPEGGPVIDKPVRTAADLDGVGAIDPQRDVPYVLETVRRVRAEIDGVTPLIGFSGAPFTLASYIVEGGHSTTYTHIKRLMLNEPETYARLMDLLTDVVVSYLAAQIEAGAQAVQLFDSWVGWLSPYDYEHLALPYVQRAVAGVRAAAGAVAESAGDGAAGTAAAEPAPIIYFANGAGGMLAQVRQAGADVYGIDWRVYLDKAWDELGDDVAVQGNLDPVTLLGPPAAVEERAADVLRRAAGRPGHIFNLGHGILPEVEPDSLGRLVDAVHRLSAR